jgi:hypothetical protein
LAEPLLFVCDLVHSNSHLFAKTSASCGKFTPHGSADGVCVLLADGGRRAHHGWPAAGKPAPSRKSKARAPRRYLIYSR